MNQPGVKILNREYLEQQIKAMQDKVNFEQQKINEAAQLRDFYSGKLSAYKDCLAFYLPKDSVIETEN